MFRRDIVVVGASAGGVEALMRLVERLPPDLEAAVFVVLHMPQSSRSMLPTILDRAGPLPAAAAVDGERIRHGVVTVALPDRHLVLEDGVVRLSRGPRENGTRPAVDPLFRSAALNYGSRVIGVVLSGNLDDGTAGLKVIKRRGGVAIVQDPEEALFPGMPTSAWENVEVDYRVPVQEIGTLVARLARDVVEEEPATMANNPESKAEEHEINAVEMASRPGDPSQMPGQASDYSCPECGGVLREIRDDNLLRFRCRVGHAYSSDSLLAGQTEAMEEALWVALRALEEKVQLARRLRERAQGNGSYLAAQRFGEQAREAERSAETLRTVLANGNPSRPHLLGDAAFSDQAAAGAS